MGEINWLEVRAGYEGGVTVRKLAAAFGIGSPGTISKRADREGWVKPLRPGDATGTGETAGAQQRKRKQERKQRKRKQGVSSAVSAAPTTEGVEPEEDDYWEGERDELSERERRFVMHYACCGVGSVAARRAGYPEGSARFRARDLLNRPRVIAAIDATREERAARLGVSADRIITELARVGLVNMTDLVRFGPGGVALNLSDDLSPDDAAAIIEVSETKDGVKIKLAPKMNALKLLAEHTGVIGRRGQEETPVDTTSVKGLLDAIDGRTRGLPSDQGRKPTE